MSESTQVNLYQAMDRFVRLSRVLPETEMRLMAYEKGKHYQIEVGTMPADLREMRLQEGSEIVIQASWEDLGQWAMLMAIQMTGEEKNATDP